MGKITLMAAALGLLVSANVMAQDAEKERLKSYSYIELQGGGQLTLTDAKMDKLITPAFGVSFGHYFSPVVGTRLHVSGYESKSGYDNIGYYKWKYVTSDLDLLVNLSQLIWPKNDHFLNLVFVGGVGLTTGWDNDDANTMAAANPALNMPLVWDDTRLSHNIRAGLRLETDARKPFGLSLEVAANSLDDRFNSKFNNSDDWMVTAMLGLSFRFGHKYTKPAPAPAPVQVVEQPKPVVVKKDTVKIVTRVIETKKPVKLHEERFYKIRSTDVEGSAAQMKRVADFLKTYPEATVNVVGYADKGTGNAKLNVKYAKQRADKYKEDLVKDYGCDAARIVTDSKGDSVQPFADNDKNRCVIVDGEATAVEKKEVKEEIRGEIPNPENVVNVEVVVK